MKKFISFILLLLFYTTGFSQTVSLSQKIEQIISNKKANIGVTVLGLETGDTLVINKNKHYPMQSVFKFHLALAVLHQVDEGKLKLDQKILVSKKDFAVETWSPIRDKYPNGGVYLPLSEILHYTVAESDNTGCDMLFRLMGGPKKVNKYIYSVGIKDFNIVANEAAMHKDDKVQYNNWTTSFAMVQVLEKFYSGKLFKK